MRGKVVIWGAGKILISMKKCIDWDEVLCILDSNPEKYGETVEGKEITNPMKLTELEYDKVIIFTSRFLDEVCLRLVGELGVRREKIMYWSDYLNCYSICQTLEQVLDDAANKGCNKLLDLKKSFWNHNVYIYPSERLIIEVVDSECNYALCKKTYAFGSVEVPEKQRAVFLGRISGFNQQDWEQLLEKYKAVYFTVSYSDEIFEDNDISCFEDKNIICEKFDLTYERLYCISAEEQEKELKIYVAAHKEFTPPKEKMYIPLWLGKSQDNKWGYQEDKDVPNIARLNLLINECTGLFWIWKHVETDYVGLVHYRRYFLNNKNVDASNILRKENALRFLKEYDFITAPLQFFPCSVASQLEETVDSDAFRKGMGIVDRIIAQKQPEYLQAFHHVFEGNSMFPCNMVITSKELLDKYCEWLFSIIIDAAEAVDISEYDTYSKRIIGFIAERLLTVWLIKQEFKIKELPILLKE